MNTPTLTTGDITQITAITDAMLALMGTTYVSCNASVTTGSTPGMPGVPSGNASSVTVRDKYGSGYTVNQQTAGVVVAVTPTTASLGPGETQQFTASVTQSGVAVPGAVVEWRVTQGSGTIAPDGLYTAPAAITAATFDVLLCTDPASGSSCSLTVSLHS
jgi:hypothetical protein